MAMGQPKFTTGLREQSSISRKPIKILTGEREIIMFKLIKKRISESAVFIFRKTPFAAAVTLVLCALCLMPASAKADVVTDWNEIGNTAVVTNARRPPAAAIVDMAYVHAAIYDAVNAIDHRYTSYAVSPNIAPLPQTSKEAAASTAAYKVLLALFPAQETFLTTRYNQYLAALPDEQPKTDGIALGNEIATKFLLSRVGDGRDA